MAKLALGRGLKSLIPTSADDISKDLDIKSEKVKSDPGGIDIISKIDISKIDVNPLQPRTVFNPESLKELKQSIQEKGVIQPITVRRKGENRYELVSGERRIRACIEAGLTQIPAYIISVSSDTEMLEIALIENIQREHLNPIETAMAFKKLIDDYGYTHEVISQKVGMDRTSVTNILRLLKLPEKIQESLSNGEITMGHAKALVNLPKVDDQVAIWQEIMLKGLSVRRVEKIVQSLPTAKAKKKTAKKKDDSSTSNNAGNEYAVSKIRSILGTKVQVETDKSTGVGKVIIEFYSDDDLSRLLELFDSIKTI
jgi:ParB family transcriptional regulator, chromosome partitioning protein